MKIREKKFSVRGGGMPKVDYIFRGGLSKVYVCRQGPGGQKCTKTSVRLLMDGPLKFTLYSCYIEGG